MPVATRSGCRGPCGRRAMSPIQMAGSIRWGWRDVRMDLVDTKRMTLMDTTCSALAGIVLLGMQTRPETIEYSRITRSKMLERGRMCQGMFERLRRQFCSLLRRACLMRRIPQHSVHSVGSTDTKRTFALNFMKLRDKREHLACQKHKPAMYQIEYIVISTG